MATATQTTPRPEDRFLAAFEVHDGHTLNGSNPQVQGLRKAAIRRFEELGFPRKAEAWKYTNIVRALRDEYQVSFRRADHGLSRADLDPFLVPDLDADVVVLVNGRYEPALSSVDALPEGVVVTSLARALEEHADLVGDHLGRYADGDEPFVALNTSFLLDGLFVYVPKNTAVERPVHVVQLTRNDEQLFVQPRHLFVVERGAEVTLFESLHSLNDTPTFTNSVTEVYVGADAHVDHYKLQDEGDGATQVHTLQVYQAGTSVFRTHTITLSGALVRNNLSFLPDAEGCETHLNGLFLGRGRMHVDNHTLVDHARPNCFSNELYKGILWDEATGVFNGKVLVRRDAQQTNAYQSNKSIVLDETAAMYSKPELEIYADDVKCSHGATTGQLDEEAVFYLRSRGLDERKARTLLLQAFARDVLDTVKVEPLRAHLDALVTDRVAHG